MRGVFARVLERKCAEFEAVHREAVDDINAHDARLLRHMQVVGMTTSKAAELQGVLRALAPKVVVCEEAAKILEAHLLAAVSWRGTHIVWALWPSLKTESSR